MGKGSITCESKERESMKRQQRSLADFFQVSKKGESFSLPSCIASYIFILTDLANDDD